MSEDQALDRIHRIGQTKEITTVRYIMKGSFEEVRGSFGKTYNKHWRSAECSDDPETEEGSRSPNVAKGASERGRFKLWETSGERCRMKHDSPEADMLPSSIWKIWSAEPQSI
jgi:hypothetical protein